MEHSGNYLKKLFSYIVIAILLSQLITNINCLSIVNINKSRELLSTTTTTTTTKDTNIKQLKSATSDKHKLFKRSPSMETEDVDPFAYLQSFGYLDSSDSNSTKNSVSSESFKEGMVKFQRFAGLPQTGLIDDTTTKYMKKPRCGNKDIIENSNNRRRKRFVSDEKKWDREQLTYRITKYPAKYLNRKDDIDVQFERAFTYWSQVTKIDFIEKVKGPVDINIKFAKRNHDNNCVPFKGPGNVLAHAFLPGDGIGGDIHFDDEEIWTLDSYDGTGLLKTAVHEIGHSLGLDHINVMGAVMYPTLIQNEPDFRLHETDMLAIRKLYGEKPTTITNN